MLDLAQRQDWEGLTVLENERGEQIRRFFAQPVTEQESVWVSPELSDILDIGVQIVAVVTKFRDEAADELNSLNRGARALRAYSGNTR
jgi:hypothetical protein